MQRVPDDEVLFGVMVAVFPAVLALLEWYRWLLAYPPHPVVFYVLAVAFAVYGVLRLRGYCVLDNLLGERMQRSGLMSADSRSTDMCSTGTPSDRPRVRGSGCRRF